MGFGMGYRWLVGALVGALGLMGCPRRACDAPLGAARRDSAGASVRVVERWRVDTVWVALAPARDSVAGARDTLSRLENAVAVSYCAVGADGRLSHSLAVKGVRVAAVAPVMVERVRDSVTWRVRVVRVGVPVPRALSAYERAAVGAFPWLALALLGWLAWRARGAARRWLRG